MLRLIRPRLAIALSVLFIPLLAGCFDTKFSLAPPESATVNLAYVGDWDVIDRDNPGSDRKTRIVVRNIDGKRYFVETTEPDHPDKPSRYVAFTADVKGVTFAH